MNPFFKWLVTMSFFLNTLTINLGIVDLMVKNKVLKDEFFTYVCFYITSMIISIYIAFKVSVLEK